jgi:hypothetical protein
VGESRHGRFVVSLDFVAVDVETANEQRGSICSFGLSVVENGKVVRSENWLTRPPVKLDWFDGCNIGLHGITPAMVKDAPPFHERMAQVLQVIETGPSSPTTPRSTSARYGKAATLTGWTGPSSPTDAPWC